MVSVKTRIDQLLKEKIFKIQGMLNIDRFYSMAAHIQIEAEEGALNELVGKFEKCQEVYHIAKKVSGKYNLIVGMLTNSLENVEEFVQREVRPTAGIRNIEIYLGDIPILPKTFLPHV